MGWTMGCRCPRSSAHRLDYYTFTLNFTATFCDWIAAPIQIGHRSAARLPSSVLQALGVRNERHRQPLFNKYFEEHSGSLHKSDWLKELLARWSDIAGERIKHV